MWLQRRMHERRNSRNLAGHGTVVEDTSACLKSKPSIEISSQLVFCVFLANPLPTGIHTPSKSIISLHD